MVLSADPEHDPAPLAMVGAAAALAISDIPFEHVLGAVSRRHGERKDDRRIRATTKAAKPISASSSPAPKTAS